ncbi:hypothetical protein FPSE5266_09275 [Fusarium pseudograminearum]|nr:hypothetical protein FPSE5266_09275 [Fusarium pseudograminearum]
MTTPTPAPSSPPHAAWNTEEGKEYLLAEVWRLLPPAGDAEAKAKDKAEEKKEKEEEEKEREEVEDEENAP